MLIHSSINTKEKSSAHLSSHYGWVSLPSFFDGTIADVLPPSSPIGVGWLDFNEFFFYFEGGNFWSWLTMFQYFGLFWSCPTLVVLALLHFTFLRDQGICSDAWCERWDLERRRVDMGGCWNFDGWSVGT